MTGGRIVGCLVLGRVISPWTKVTVRYLVQELHSTKGWKPRTEVSASRFPWLPPSGSFCWTGGCGPRKSVSELVPVITEKSLMRHGWYRRKKRKEEEARHDAA